MDLFPEFKEKFVVAKPFGKINAMNAEDFTKSLLELLQKNNNMILDFKDVDYISSAGLRSVLVVAKSVQSNNGLFVICSLQENIYEIFNMTGFTEILNVKDTYEEAVKLVEG